MKKRGSMYVHIGDNKSIPIESVITMVHAQGSKAKKSPIHYYDGPILNEMPAEDIKTYIVTDEGLYGSSISLKTLMKRIEEFQELIHLNI